MGEVDGSGGKSVGVGGRRGALKLNQTFTGGKGRKGGPELLFLTS